MFKLVAKFAKLSSDKQQNGIFFKTKTTRKFLFLTINGEHSDFFGKISGNRWNIVALAVSQS